MLPTRVERIDLASGRRELVRTLGPADTAGAGAIYGVQFTPDERGYAYGFGRCTSQLFLVEGAR